VVAWDVADRKKPVIAADLVSRACLKERYCCAESFAESKGRQQTLILHADNAIHSCRLLEELRAATLEVRLEELGVLRSFARPRVSNNNPYNELLFRTAKYRHNSPGAPFRAWRRPTPRWRHSWTGSTTGTATAGSG